jgi:hypothetical protein
MDRVDGRAVEAGMGSDELQAIIRMSSGPVFDGLYRILSVALPTFDQTLRWLSGDDELDTADLAGETYGHAFSRMVDNGMDEEDAFTQDLLQMIAQVPYQVIR